MLFLKKIKGTLAARAVAVALIVSFSIYNIGFALPEAEITPPNIAVGTRHLSVDDIGVAINTGTVRSRYEGNSGKLIVHIQDAHCNFEAQSNISSILEQLSKESGIDMISVEGAEGDVDTTWFRAFPDAEIRREVATYFMKKGEITGAEYFSINSDYKGTIFGAETRDYYVQNLNAFMDVYPHKDMIEKYFNDLRSVATRLKALVYHPKLRELDSRIQAFNGKEKELSDFAAYLAGACSANGINTKDYPDFKKLTDTLEYEKKIDFDIVDSERGSYIDMLSSRLSKEEMAELVAASVRFKKGHIKAVDFYTYLRDLAREHDIAIVQEYPNLFYYYIYTRIYDGINVENLFREIDAIGRTLKAKLIENDLQRDLDRYSEKVDMLVKLTNIELTNECYDLYKEYSSSFSLDDVLAFYSTLVSKYNLNFSIGALPEEIRQNLPQMIAFYEIAIKRDKALIDNTIRQMEAEGKDSSVLIAGGFHTRGITDILQSKGISYVVVTPKITQDVDSPYIQVLTNQRTSIEDIITESAAMPGATRASSERSDRATGSFLSPIMRFGYGITMYLNPEQRDVLIKLSEDTSAEGMPGLFESISVTFNEAISMLANQWIADIRTRMETQLGMTEQEARAEFDKFLDNDDLWGMLTAVYLSKYDEYFDSVGRVPNQEVKNAIKDQFENFRSVRRAGSAIQETTPGRQAIGPVRGLSIEQAEALDRVLRQSFEEGTYSEKKMNVDGVDFTIVVHFGLKERIERVNAASEEVEIPLDLHMHPGRGGEEMDHVLLQGHIDAREFIALTESERVSAARHEIKHLEMFNDPDGQLSMQRDVYLTVNRGKTEEDFVDSLSGANASGIRAKLARIEKMRQASVRALDSSLSEQARLEAMEEYLKADIDHGTHVRKTLISMAEQGQDRTEYIKQNFARRYNIEKQNYAFLKGLDYDGYEYIIISSSEPDAARIKGQRARKDLEQLNIIRKKNGLEPVRVFSVTVSEDAGQLVSHIIALESANREAMKHGIDLRQVMRENSRKIAVFHDGGMASRYSPGKADDHQRGLQTMAGYYINSAADKVEADLIGSVMNNSQGFAVTNDRAAVDVFWTSQLSSPTIPISQIPRADTPFTKLYVPIDWSLSDEELAPLLYQFGTLIHEGGVIVEFFGNKDEGAARHNEKDGTYSIERPKENDSAAKKAANVYFRLREKGASAGYDYGSFSMNNAMTLALWDYWTNIRNEDGEPIVERFLAKGEYDKPNWERAIDPNFTRPLASLLKWLRNNQNILRDLPSPEELRAAHYGERKKDDQEKLARAVSRIRGALPNDIRVIMGDVKEDASGEKTIIAKPFVTETIEFFLMYRDDKAIFPDLTNVISARPLGKNTSWMTFRNVLDMANDKLSMLANGTGEYVALAVGANNYGVSEVKKDNPIFAEEKRKSRNIKDSEWCDFYLGDEHYVVSREQVTGTNPWELVDEKTGETLISIHNSIIRGSVLEPGSSVTNSVVDRSYGRINKLNSYVHGTTARRIDATNSIMLKIVDMTDEGIKASGLIAIDVFRESLGMEDQRFQKNQTRVTAKVGYVNAAKEYDKMKISELGNVFAVGEQEIDAQGNVVGPGLRGYRLNIPIDRAIENAQRLSVLINTGQRAALNYEIATLERAGYFTHGLMERTIGRFYSEDNPQFAPDSKARTEMVYFLKLVAEKYGDKAVKAIAEKEKDLLLSQGVTVDPDIYRRDSIRAVADVELPDNVVKAAGRAYVYLLADILGKDPAGITIAIGRESRESGARLMTSFIRGAVSAGATVMDATNGAQVLTSSPLMYFASRYLLDSDGADIDGIVEITASHLPGEQNGFKATVGSVNFTSAEMVKWFEKTHQMMDQKSYEEYVRDERLREKVSPVPVLDSYQVLLMAALEGSDEWNALVNDVYAGRIKLKDAIDSIRPRAIKYMDSKPLEGMKLAADSGFGSMGPIIAPISAALGADLVDIGPESDYSRAIHDANPNNPDNLINIASPEKGLVSAVQRLDAYFGMGFDVDGDRLGVVTRNGAILRGDDISVIMVPEIIKDAIKKAEQQGIKDYKPVVVANVLCSDRLKKVIERAGGVAVESAVGFNKVKEAMVEHDAIMGVEISSHIMFKENFNADDAFFAVVKLLGVLSDKADEYRQQGQEVPADLVDILLERANDDLGISGDYHTGEWRTPMISNNARVEVANSIRDYYTSLASESPDRYRVRNTLDGIKIDFLENGQPVGFLAVRPSGTSPEMVVVANSLDSEEKLQMIKNDFFAQLAKYKEKVKWEKNGKPALEPGSYYREAREAAFGAEQVLSAAGTPGVQAIRSEKVMLSPESSSTEILRMPFVKGGPILTTEERDVVNTLVLTEDEEGNIEARDEVEIFSPAAVSTPALLEGRVTAVDALAGKVTIAVDDEDPETVPAGMTYRIDQGSENVILSRGNDEKAVAAVRYTNTPEEQAAYQTIYMVQKHLAEIKKQKIRLHVPDAMFPSGGRHDVGSLEWTKMIVNRLVGDNVVLSPYTYSLGLRELAGRPDDEYVNILVASSGHLEDARYLRDESVKDFVSRSRPLPIPEAALNLGGWDFAFETVGWGLILGAVKSEQIRDVQDLTSPAADMHKFIRNVLKRDVPREYLYMMMPYETRHANIENITDQEVKEALESQTDIFAWMKFLVRNILFSMPIKALDPTDALRQRMKVLWSA